MKFFRARTLIHLLYLVAQQQLKITNVLVFLHKRISLLLMLFAKNIRLLNVSLKSHFWVPSQNRE